MLYLHCGARSATYDEVQAVPTPTLEDVRAVDPTVVGSKWRPVRHGDLVDAILGEAARRDLEVERAAYGLSKDRLDLLGCLDFDAPVYGAAPGRMKLALGFRSSNAQRFGLRGVTAGRVFVCDNGAIVGDFAWGRKHTSGLDLEATIREGFDTFARQAEDLAAWTLRLAGVDLDGDAGARRADHLLLEAARRDLVAPSQLLKVDREWREPRHEDFAPRNGWSLYQALTEVAKDWAPTRAERALRGFPELILN